MGARITCKVVVHSKHSSLPNGWSNSSLEPKYNRIARSNERGGVTNGITSVLRRPRVMVVRHRHS